MFKVRFKERLFIIFFACFLAIYPPTVKYQEVQALEWAIPTVAFDTALKFLLGLLGVSITSKALHDNVDWNQVQQDAMNYQIQKGNDAVAVGEWWEDVAKGTLNQASSCWSAFKEWVQSMVSSSGSVVGNKVTVSSDNVFGIDSFDYFQVNLSDLSTKYYFTDTDYFIISGADSSILNNTYTIVPFYNSSTSSYSIPLIFSNVPIYTGLVVKAYVNGSLNGTYTMDRSFGYVYNEMEVHCIRSFPVTPSLTYQKQGWLSIFGENVVSDGIFDSANENIQDTAITTGDTTTTAIPDTLPLPWDNVSDVAEGVSDAIDALQEQVAEGVISLEQYWERVQEMVNALAIDTTTEETLPVTQNPDTGETEKIEDIANENVSNTAFTLNGLEKVFPFCIPWDIYAFVTLLVAEPVAPVINYPIYNPVTNEDINITIDFSDWETVVVLFRYILDFLLIIGLLLLARQLSGAGGDD